MSGPCFDTELLKKKIPFTVEQRIALRKELRENYTDHGVPFDRAIRALARDVGWHPEAIIQAISDPASRINPRRQFSAMFKRQADRNATINEAKRLIATANSNPVVKGLAKAWDFQRAVSTFAHFAVFPGTHMKESILIPREWGELGRAVGKSYRLAGPHWQEFHEYQRFKMESDQNYGSALKSGLDIGRGEPNIGGTAKRAAAAFDFIKQARLERWNRMEGDKLSPEDQKTLSTYINHSTGSVKLLPGIGPAMGKVLFAPKLWPAQIQTALDLFRAMTKFGKGTTAGERVSRNFVFSRMAQLAATSTALLGANYIAGQMSGRKEDQPNLTGAGKASFLRPHIAGHSVMLSPTLELLKLPFAIMSHASSSHNAQDSIVKDVVDRLGLYHAHPMIKNALEAATGKDMFSQNPLPFRGVLAAPEPTAKHPRESWTEFLGNKMPIPVAAGAREFYDQMRAEGLDHPTAKSWIEAILGFGVGQTGLHENADYPGQYDESGGSSRPHAYRPKR